MSRRIIDLTYPIHEGMTTYPKPWHPFVEISQLGRHGIENRETRKIVLGSHTGTHCDAPRHFIPDGLTVDNIDLDILIGSAIVLNFSYCKSLEEISIGDIKKQLNSTDAKRVIFRFDWSQYWGGNNFYSGHPYLSEDAAKWLVDYGVKLVAMDTPMPDSPQDNPQSKGDSPIHKIFLSKGVVLVEYLCNLNQLDKKEIFFVVMPLKILNADGSPARCIAIEDKQLRLTLG